MTWPAAQEALLAGLVVGLGSWCVVNSTLDGRLILMLPTIVGLRVGLAHLHRNGPALAGLAITAGVGALLDCLLFGPTDLVGFALGLAVATAGVLIGVAIGLTASSIGGRWTAAVTADAGQAHRTE